LEKEPLLNQDILKGGGMYVEYRSDDARLTIEVMKTAVANGALCLNYMECIDFKLNENNKISGVVAKDMFTDEEITIHAKKVINAAGPWVDNLRKIDNSLKGKRLHLTKGIHLVVSKSKIPIRHAVYFDVADGRMIFAIPRGKIVYIGTTDTNYSENTDYPFADKKDAAYVLEAVNRMFPSVQLTENDIISTWAGLRPLIHEDGKSPSDLSRKDEIFISDTNLISIAGGKLTGFRKMAQRAVDVVCRQLKKEGNRKFGACSTAFIPLSGGELEGKSIEEYARQIQLKCKCFDLEDVTELVEKYGSNTPLILEIAENETDKNLLQAEALYAINHEMVYNIADFLIRRTGRVYFERDSIAENIEGLHGFFTAQLQQNKVIADVFKQDFLKEYEGVVAFRG
jgi:glycerol-3-phosphate dehydrogenase